MLRYERGAEAGNAASAFNLALHEAERADGTHVRERASGCSEHSS
jgi:hypothetical protein